VVRNLSAKSASVLTCADAPPESSLQYGGELERRPTCDRYHLALSRRPLLRKFRKIESAAVLANLRRNMSMSGWISFVTILAALCLVAMLAPFAIPLLMTR